MNLKRKMRRTVGLISCLATVMFFISCSKDENGINTGSERVIAKFKDYLYENGQVRANRLTTFEDTEWAVATDNPRRPLEVFSDITGSWISPTENYDYKYESPDGKCFIHIKGTLNPDSNAVYATMYIRIDECPEITRLHITTQDFFQGTNGNNVEHSTAPGVPVIW